MGKTATDGDSDVPEHFILLHIHRTLGAERQAESHGSITEIVFQHRQKSLISDLLPKYGHQFLLIDPVEELLDIQFQVEPLFSALVHIVYPSGKALHRCQLTFSDDAGIAVINEGSAKDRIHHIVDGSRNHFGGVIREDNLPQLRLIYIKVVVCVRRVVLRDQCLLYGMDVFFNSAPECQGFTLVPLMAKATILDGLMDVLEGYDLVKYIINHRRIIPLGSLQGRKPNIPAYTIFRIFSEETGSFTPVYWPCALEHRVSDVKVGVERTGSQGCRWRSSGDCSD